MRSRLAKFVLSIAVAVAPLLALAQDFGFTAPASAGDPALPAALNDLASRILPVYQDGETDRYLSNVAALQMAVGDPDAAYATRMTLRERQETAQGTPPAGRRSVVYNIYTQARANESPERPFTSAYGEAFREALGRLSDLEAYELEGAFVTPLEPLQQTLQRALDAQQGKTAISLPDALDLVQTWFVFEAYRSFGGVVRALLQEDKEKRYVIDENVQIPVAGGRAAAAAALIRPRGATGTGKLPTLLEFTLDRSKWSSREAAAHGYVSVIALARIAGDPAFRPRAPFESDGDDARAVIDWIAQQPWSDGRVGMQGTGYGGFVAWAAAKKLPEALEAIATSDPIAPGIDVPMVNRIAHNSAYRWVYELLAEPGDEWVNDVARWRALDEEWFRSGRIYRDLPAMPGRAAAIFRSWLNHPSYDRFWQKWLPFGAEFASIDIPVLTVTGYYSAGETAALYYFTQHHAQDADANHALLIGPFDREAVQRGASPSVGEIALDAAAIVDPNAARYAWFAHALLGAERPPLLAANVNYELAGANEWRHEASLAPPESPRLRLYLAPSPAGDSPHALAPQPAAAPMAITDSLSLKNRDEAEWRPAPELVRRELGARDGTVFVSEPFAETLDLAGQLRGELDFTVNKYDVDLVVSLYELRASGEYVKLFDPPYAFRASYARDRVRRRLLPAGVRQQLPFESDRMIGRRLEPGSRLALAIAINKRADQQVNYGAGGDVSEESIEAAGAPVRIRWHEGSFVEIPSRPRAAEAPRAAEPAPEPR